MHLHRTDGTDQDDGIAIVPYILVDISYQFYASDILPLQLRHEAKRARTKWADSQHRCMRELSSCYTPDEYGEFLDLMDELAEFVSNDLVVLRVQGMNCVAEHFQFEQQKIISSVLVSNYVALLAQEIWTATHTNARGDKAVENANINGIMQWSKEFSREYINQFDRADFTVPDEKVEQLNVAVKVFVRKVAKWVKERMMTSC